jgi:hypothetical protein
MTQREKSLAGLLFGLMVVVGGGLAGYVFVYRPLSDVRSQIGLAEGQLAKKQQEVSLEEQQIDAVFKVNPRLKQWPKLSLPPRDPTAKKVPVALQEEAKKAHLNQLQVDYEKYLYQTMTDSGLKQVRVIPRAIERQAGRGFRGPPPLYEQLTFGVEAQGTMAEVSKALSDFHNTPLLHKVKGLTLTMVTANQPGGGQPQQPGGPFGNFGFRRRGAPAEEGTLDLKMTVEALMVNGGEARVGLLPSKLAYPPKVLAVPERDYGVLDKRNMFTGFNLPDTSPVERKGGPGEKPEDVLRFVKLTMLFYNPDRNRWEATLYDQAKGGGEKKLNERTLNKFTIADRYKNTVLSARVLKITEEVLVILADGKFYGLQCGDMLHPAVIPEKDKPGSRRMMRADVRALGIDPDKELAKEKKEKEEEEGEEG